MHGTFVEHKGAACGNINKLSCLRPIKACESRLNEADKGTTGRDQDSLKIVHIGPEYGSIPPAPLHKIRSVKIDSLLELETCVCNRWNSCLLKPSCYTWPPTFETFRGALFMMALTCDYVLNGCRRTTKPWHISSTLPIFGDDSVKSLIFVLWKLRGLR